MNNVDQTSNLPGSSPRHPTTGDIRFRRGEPYSFIATKSFALGSTGVTVRASDEVLYDGTTATVNGEDYNLPLLRGAIKAHWLVLSEEFDEEENYNQAVRANIQVRPAIERPGDKGRVALTTTESDEREVGNYRQYADKTRTANANYVRGRTQVNVVAPGTKVRDQHGGMMTIEAQDGIDVGRKLRTPAGERSKNQKTQLSSEAAADALRLANNVQIEPGRGISREEMLERMTEEERAHYEAQIESRRGAYVAEAAPTRIVGRVKTAKTSESHGIKTTNFVGGGTSYGDGSDGEIVGSVSHDVQDHFESEGITFKTTNAPKVKKAPVARVEKADAPKKAAPTLPPEVRKTIAKGVCADFPDNYDFALSVKKKMARITADFEEREDVLRAIYAAEDDEMRAFLVQEFPSAFGA